MGTSGIKSISYLIKEKHPNPTCPKLLWPHRNYVKAYPKQYQYCPKCDARCFNQRLFICDHLLMIGVGDTTRVASAAPVAHTGSVALPKWLIGAAPTTLRHSRTYWAIHSHRAPITPRWSHWISDLNLSDFIWTYLRKLTYLHPGKIIFVCGNWKLED